VFQQAEGFYRQALFRDRFVCVVRADHPGIATPFDLDGYLALSHVLIAPRGQRGGVVDNELERIGRKRRVAVRLSHYLAAPYVVTETDLCLTVTERAARSACASFPLRQLEVPLVLSDMVVAQFWHARDHEDPAHAWLRATLADVATAL
jgi:DNA-binding transcriptional LysR family regulator